MFVPVPTLTSVKDLHISRISLSILKEHKKGIFVAVCILEYFLLLYLEMYKHDKFQKIIDLENLGQLLNMDFQYVTWVQYLVEQEYLYLASHSVTKT
jgi:hypothetical protein